MAQEGRPQERPVTSGDVPLQDLPVGSKVRLRNGAVAEVTENPRDGGWVFIRFVEHPEDPSRVGEDDMAFCDDVVAVV